MAAKIIKFQKCQTHGNQSQTIHLAYLAGLMDGEGTIRIDRLTAKPDMNNPQYSVHMSIGSVDEIVPKLFHETFQKGSRRVECVLGKRPIYRWHLRGSRAAVSVLNALLPYLILKKERAELALSFIKNWKTPYARRKGIDSIELQRREEAYRKMRKFNAVGVGATTKPSGTREGETIVCT